MIYVLMGPPACGKSTQGMLLQKVTGMRYVSIGQLLRQQAEHDADYASHLAQGDLFPAEIIQALLEHLHRESPDHLIIDGAFRRPSQVDKLADLWGEETIVVVLFEAPDDILEARSEHRTAKRTDDTEKTMAHRLELYHASLPGILDRIHARNLPLITIDATPSVDAIHHEVITKLQPYDLPTKN